MTPKIIETEEEYGQFLAIAERLTFKKNQTPEESALYDLVTILVKTYEAKHYVINESSPAEILMHIIESSGIQSDELAEIFDSSEALTQVLAGEKLISAGQAQALSKKFRLSPNLFLKL